MLSYLFVILKQFIQQGYLNTHHRNITQAKGGGKDQRGVLPFSKIPLGVYYQCCVLIGSATTRLYVMPISSKKHEPHL